MWSFTNILLCFDIILVVSAIQVHEDVIEHPSTTVPLPLEIPKSQISSLVANTTTSPETELKNNDRVEDISRQNYEGKSDKDRDNISANTNSSSYFTDHIHIPDTNSQSSIKQFVPSPQLNAWNEKVTWSPEHIHFQPLRSQQYKILQTKIKPVSFKNTEVFLSPEAMDKGHFIWVPHSSETTTIQNTKLPSISVRNPWRWTIEPDTSFNNVFNNNNKAYEKPTYMDDNIKTWSDYKRNPTKDKPYPYVLSDSASLSAWTPEKALTETSNTGMENTESKSKSHQPSSLSLVEKSPWKKLAHILTAAIPIGLLISALTPHMVYVNPNNTYPPIVNPALSIYPGRLRSLDDTYIPEKNRKMKNPLMDFISIFSDANNDVGIHCENRVFCELSRMGAYKDSDVLQKMLWKIANETPDTIAKKTSLITIFRAIRENKCGIFHCNMHTSTLSSFQTVDKLSTT